MSQGSASAHRRESSVPHPPPRTYSKRERRACHIWPQPIAQGEDCVKAVYTSTVCPTAHAGVLGFDTGPINIPIP